jgi:hypothetical protein
MGVIKTWLPAAVALGGCAVLTLLDASNFFFVFPRLPFGLLLVLALLFPGEWASLRARSRMLPIGLAMLWMVALPWIPTSHTKSFFLTAWSLDPGMSVESVRARMEPFLEVGVEYDWPPDEAWAYPAAGPGTLVFLSSVEGGQVCQVFYDSRGVTGVEADYVD